MYGDLKGFNSTIGKAKFADFEGDHSALAKFASGFSTISPFIDFIDTGDRYITKNKIKGMYSLKDFIYIF